jgi:hypothetical protein
VTFNIPFLGGINGKIGTRCAATGAHLAKLLFGGSR